MHRRVGWVAGSGRSQGRAGKAERRRAKNRKAKLSRKEKLSNKQEQKQRESTISLGIIVEFPTLFGTRPCYSLINPDIIFNKVM